MQIVGATRLFGYSLGVNRLQEIIAGKSGEIASARSRAKELRALAERRTDFRDFASAIQRCGGRLKIIAETKKASPSAGLIAKSYDPVAIAKRFEANGADAISILTERNYFLGSIDHLRAAREKIGLPVLRKDFLVDEAQILESAASNADAILLIVAAVNPERLRSLHECATANKLSALVEVHTADELKVAVDAGARIIGINNRDLATFEVDLETTEKLLPHIPTGIRIVSESGIRNSEDVAKMADFPIDALLIGEALIRADPLALSKILARG
jgi:indole-3-glycerol phosphate synthase